MMTAAGLCVLGQAGDAAAAVGQEVTANPARVQSVWDLAVKGGPMMIPIGICSLVAFAVLAERLITLRKRHIIPRGFLPGVEEALGEGARQRQAGIDYCKKNRSPIASIFLVAIKRLGQPIELMEKHVQEAGQREVMKLRKYLRLLSLIASITPLMGLLGTIFGMIKAFQTVALSGESLGKAELLATGIYEAMITTAAGLLVAIPTLLAYHWIAARIEGLVIEIDRITFEFVEKVTGISTVSTAGGPEIRAVSKDGKKTDGAAPKPAVASA